MESDSDSNSEGVLQIDLEQYEAELAQTSDGKVRAEDCKLWQAEEEHVFGLDPSFWSGQCYDSHSLSVDQPLSNQVLRLLGYPVDYQGAASNGELLQKPLSRSEAGQSSTGSKGTTSTRPAGSNLEDDIPSGSQGSLSPVKIKLEMTLDDERALGGSMLGCYKPKGVERKSVSSLLQAHQLIRHTNIFELMHKVVESPTGQNNMISTSQAKDIVKKEKFSITEAIKVKPRRRIGLPPGPDSSGSSTPTDVVIPDTIPTKDTYQKLSQNKLYEQSWLDEPEEVEAEEFSWPTYLEDTGSLPAAGSAFEHIEASLQSIIQPGLLVELPHKRLSPTVTGMSRLGYWPAEVVYMTGPAGYFRWLGLKDRSQDFFIDMLNTDVRPSGWCMDHNLSMLAPMALRQLKASEISELLTDIDKRIVTSPKWWFEKKLGMFRYNYILEGSLLELQHPLEPCKVWFVRVVSNVGGRLQLRYSSAKTDNSMMDKAKMDKAKRDNDIFLYYLHPMLHKVGWGQESGEAVYALPSECKDVTQLNVESVKSALFDEAKHLFLPDDLFEGQEVIESHSMRLGSKLEVLDPIGKMSFYPATVTRIFSNKYFEVTVDDLTVDIHSKASVVCHMKSKCIFPAKWCVKRGIRLSPPKGWRKPEFEWSEYVREMRADLVHEYQFNPTMHEVKFDRGMKLEAAHPDYPDQLYGATITRTVGHLMWIHLDKGEKVVHRFITDVNSLDVYPLGWSDIHGYSLNLPANPVVMAQRRNKFITSRADSPEEYRLKLFNQVRNKQGLCFVYFNTQCFSGPFLHKSKVAELPSYCGPGPIDMVMKQAVNKLISTGYKPTQVLGEIQAGHVPFKDAPSIKLKARGKKGKPVHAQLQVGYEASQVDEFCRFICAKLDCCPKLISSEPLEGACPENCQQFTKTKNGQYTRYQRVGGAFISDSYNSKRPVGRPPKKKRGRKPFSAMDNDAESGDEMRAGDADGDGEGHGEVTPRKKRKYSRKQLPPTEIKTRGVQLPSYSTALNEKRPRRYNHDDQYYVPRHILAMSSATASKPTATVTTDGSPRKRGRPKKNQLRAEEPPAKQVKIEPGDNGRLLLTSNPRDWTIENVADFISKTDAFMYADCLKYEEIDGFAFMMLTMDAVRENFPFELGPALKLCHQVVKVKTAYALEYQFESRM